MANETKLSDKNMERGLDDEREAKDQSDCEVVFIRHVSTELVFLWQFSEMVQMARRTYIPHPLSTRHSQPACIRAHCITLSTYTVNQLGIYRY